MYAKFKPWLKQVNVSLPLFIDSLKQPGSAGRYHPCLNGSKGAHELRSICLNALGYKLGVIKVRQFLLIIWIVGIMALYLLLFSPPLYWSILGKIDISYMLNAWRMQVIELFELNKGFH